MGGGRDKRKKAQERSGDVSAAGKGQHKTERKTAKNAEKSERRTDRKLDGDEDDIDALLAKFALAEKAKTTVTVDADCAAPSARVSASFTAHVSPGVSEILIFGGECIDLRNGKVHTYNDLYKYSTDKRKWARISCPHSPAPRSAHQAVLHKGCMYIFGGEFTSPNQERFHHFKDLWRLDLSTWAWDELPARAGPSGRSGHRMVAHKNKLILFGGFYDNGKEVKYYSDLWELDVAEMKWTSVGSHATAASGTWPSPRSGCQVAVFGDTLFLFGGYSKAADESDAELEHGMIHDDLWALDLTKPPKWERVKKAGMAPGPRASFALALHKGRALLFGGAADNEIKGGEDLSSDFLNDLYSFNFTTRRWYAAEMRRPPAKQLAEEVAGAGAAPAPATEAQAAEREAAALAAASGKSAAAQQAEVLHRAAARIQAHFRGYVVRKAYKLYRIGGVVSEILYSPAAFGLDMSTANLPKPRGRIGAQMTVVGHQLWLFAGTVELGDKEVTLDDLWCLDLNKMDGWQLVKENTVGEELFRQAAADGGAAAGSSSESEDSDQEATHSSPAKPGGKAAPGKS